MTICWYLWKMRNGYLFQQCPGSPATVIQKSKLALCEPKSISVDPYYSSLCRFPPGELDTPPEDFVKMNFDGEVNPFNETAGGYCAELQRRNVTSAIVITHPPEAELQALFQWVNISWRKGFNRVILKGDCLILVENRVNSGRRLSYASREFKDGNPSWDFMLTWKKLLNRLKVF